MMKNILMSSALFLLALPVIGQQYERQQEFTVMNPTSFEMSRFELTPVNKYTGKANVNFPLCNIAIDDKQLGLSLSYDTGGIRVAQEATWVGLGWNLGGLPVITHQINQRSDIGNKNSPNTGYCFEPALPQGGITEAYAQYVANAPTLPYGQPDTQPDVFVANLMGATVKFQLTQKAVTTTIEVIHLDEGNADITYNEATQDFTVIDEEGYQYDFTHTEYSTTWSQEGGSLGFEWEPNQIIGVDGSTQYNTGFDRWIPTAWYVDKITSPDGHVLEFTYDDELDDAVNVTASHPVYSSNITLDLCALQIQGGSLDGWQFASFENVTASRTLQEVKVLSQIENTTTGERLVFNTAPREDIHPYSTDYLGNIAYTAIAVDPTPKRLTDIEVYASATDKTKTIAFQQSYFNEFRLGTPNAVDYLRLKLDGFSMYDQQYAFKYKCDDALPEKHSKSVDFWGFYNGIENSWRIPFVKVQGNCPFDNPAQVLNEAEVSSGATKGSHFESTLIGSLEEIRYPTGGTSQFQFENNEVTVNPFDNILNADDFNAPHLFNHSVEPGYPISAPANPDIKTYAVGGLRIKRVVNTDKDGGPLLQKSYSYLDTIASGVVASSGVLMDPMHFFRSSIRSTGDQASNLPNYSGTLFYGFNISNGNVFGTNNSAMGGFMGYTKVTELIESATNATDNGRIVSKYINIPNESLAAENGDYAYIVESIPHHYESANGKLLREEVYDTNGAIKRVDEFNYVIDVYENATASDFYQVGYKLYYGGSPANLIIDWHEYDARKFVTWLTKSKSVEHLDDGQLVKAERNEYNDYDRLEAVQRTTSKTATIDYASNLFNPLNSERIEYYYPYDYEYGVDASAISSTLFNDNRISQPIYTRYFNNGRFVGHQLTKFAVNNGNTKPEGVYYNKEDKTLASMENRVTYDEYDGYGNLVQYRQADGVPVSAIWGYNGRYMVAKLENVTYQQIENLSEFGSGFDLGNTGLTTQQKNQLKGLPESMPTFYDYDPQVGMTQMTDTRDYETNYVYDQYNRLVEIRDEQNNLIEDYRYEFADVGLYPTEEFSECFNLLTIDRIRTTNNRVQYFSVEADVSGGFGAYTYAWFIGTGTSARTATFDSNPTSTTLELTHEVCCDTRIFIKLEVSDGTQTATRIIENPNYDHPECSPTACTNGNF
ncbi:hypothetical protein ABV409_14960 [Flagellimonas sp. DF-77]|uniref:hypothetical protein n=1 Tax=Flagellimonas algarum TaxID=3230298 RepID=UPI0033934703